jgi:Polysaccharide biosynthesis
MRIITRIRRGIRKHILRRKIEPEAAGPNVEIVRFAREIGLDTSDLTGIILEVEELRAIAKEILAKPHTSLLVFGCGNDSVFWEKVNRGGNVAFLEDDPHWAAETQKKLGAAAVHVVHYGTKRPQWRELLDDPSRLSMELPPEIEAKRWDIILVDGPAGFDDERPGRMKSIYAASRLVAPGGRVFVHDCERQVEDEFASRYLGRDRLFMELQNRVLLRGYAF